jgi:hypothetical protein
MNVYNFLCWKKNEILYFFKTGLHVFSALTVNFSALDEDVDNEMQATSQYMSMSMSCSRNIEMQDSLRPPAPRATFVSSPPPPWAA